MYSSLAVGSSLDTPKTLSYLDIKSVNVDDNNVTIEVSELALFDEVSIKDDIYELVMLTLNELNELDVSVSFTINGEDKQVSGYEKAVTVNSIYYNDLKI